MKVNVSSLSYLTEGGEGTIYSYDNDTIIKIYKPKIDIASKQNKIDMLINNKLPSTVIAPIEKVFDMKNTFIGYRMKCINGEDFTKLSSKKFIKSNNVTLKDILKMILDVRNTLDSLHNKDIYIGDLNDQNILFDLQYNVYFIDCDSWSIGNEKCLVAIDSFKDPLLVANNFNKDTDTYAFAILAWRSLTGIHPFAGTMKPDISILERMKRGLSIIDNPDVTIPRTTKSWKNLSPNLISTMKSIFENKTRSFGNELDDLYSNLKFCDVDKVYYYGKYRTCPICDNNAKINIAPISQGSVSGISIVAVLDAGDIKLVINENTYIDTKNRIVDIRSGNKVLFIPGNKYYFTKYENMVVDKSDYFTIYQKGNSETFKIEKRFKSDIVVVDDRIYYLSRKNSLIEIIPLHNGNHITKKASTSNTSYFDVFGDHFCILNVYDNRLITNIDGYNYEIPYSDVVVNYGIHYDNLQNSWLVIVEGRSNTFKTLVIHKNQLVFGTDAIKYQCALNNLCIYNNIIFVPTDGSIRGFAFNRDVFKDFKCSVVSNDSKIVKRDNRFTIVNDDNIYRFG